MPTRRQKLIEMLEKGEWSVQGLANEFCTTVKDILKDFEHIPYSIRPKKLGQNPAYCRNCGFSFKERSRHKTPSKCPKCRSEDIQPALFKIV
jgi:transcriptional regulator